MGVKDDDLSINLYLSVCLSVCLSVYLSVSLSICIAPIIIAHEGCTETKLQTYGYLVVRLDHVYRYRQSVLKCTILCLFTARQPTSNMLAVWLMLRYLVMGLSFRLSEPSAGILTATFRFGCREHTLGILVV